MPKKASDATEVELLAAILLNAYRDGKHDQARARLGAGPVGLAYLPDDEEVEHLVFEPLTQDEGDDLDLRNRALSLAKEFYGE